VPNSLRFWRDTLRVPVIWEQPSPPDATHTITGAPVGATMKVVWLGLPQTPRVGGSDQPNHISTLELIEYELPADLPEADKARTPQARPWDIGAVHVNLIVQGLDEILERVKAEGFHVFSDIFTVPQEAPVPEARGQRICYVRGPDGELVELTDIPKQE
jgi:catechol 2,3-dioxygenase-like lactoylglutathione lyase family enzyme